jgi:hypothetical protein
MTTKGSGSHTDLILTPGTKVETGFTHMGTAILVHPRRHSRVFALLVYSASACGTDMPESGAAL